ncbi:hypothetical protein D1AOALGA4SA_8241 [Olavius algarvensis Delta 1 endosymbiont]|nr:hypothetical protein D1AOALGA4SA_8241 [Olavius algarvensis Delta 1 endosymbiont]
MTNVELHECRLTNDECRIKEVASLRHRIISLQPSPLL